jgi:hypothetical protein
LPRGSACPDAEAFELEYCSLDGERTRSALSTCWMMPFERFSPVRPFPSYKGQSSFPGWWWFATTGEHAGYESWFERENLIALDADPDVIGVASQPFWIYWRTTVGAVGMPPTISCA